MWLHRILTVACLSSVGLADVLVVDTAGGGDFTLISAASVAAQDSDTLLVRPGVYSAFIVNDKSLAVVGDPSGAVIVEGADGEDGEYDSADLLADMITDCTDVAIEGCTFRGGEGHPRWNCGQGYGADGLRVVHSNVVVASSMLFGGDSGALTPGAVVDGPPSLKKRRHAPASMPRQRGCAGRIRMGLAGKAHYYNEFEEVQIELRFMDIS